ncbi:EscU/YscU/HrcU family type III secretion system export apparatus switch protein [Roseateles puraquae]|uniref:EscU/YscU/HrcU family type III secretion system export apparatus switch protein n=1 Tax=Roseateles puraquae TaxID=431059 RepID=A0A254NB95_9BURK|nr:EscU/YscU/HrcU family type III secretion system export apparatus switch protein [Roseateles puraquae]MDG0856474.1 EscU/YscU/HrcU family type III secretion system export apparatus switch protein [Roseateles puraquae]OWR02688.1 EscU/YscU/HrcU family type III secretion system export apparatus switch protein [Roseateles puraquae]
MAEDSGDKTEQPTPKRLQDARKKGDVAKGRELTSTATLLVWLVAGALCLPLAAERIAALCESLFARVASGWRAEGFGQVAALLGWQSIELALLLVAVLMLPVAVLGMLVEYLQAGPVLAFEKVAPKLENLNPAAGLKRMFSLDNLIELLKGILKTALLLAIGWAVARTLLPDAMRLALSTDRPAQHLGALVWQGTVKTLAWTVGVFAGVAFLDFLWTRHRFTKKMRMSLRDIKQEMKESEGDPHLKQQRKQAHAEWSQRNQAAAARGASALIVNPTHVAIAIDFEPGRCPVPTVSAKGEDHVARAMREAAGEAGVPIVRNVPLARELLARCDEGEVVPPELFDVLAEVIVWADGVREQLRWEAARADPHRRHEVPEQPPPARPAPGEDLTLHPDLDPRAAATP